MKRRTSRWLSILLALCLALALLPGTALAEDTSYPVIGGNVYFDSTTGTITGCDKDVTEAFIPSKINGTPVTTIGDRAFSGCKSLISVIIPDGVTTIGQAAFNSCYKLANVIIPDSVTTIRDSAFYYCYALTSVDIPNGVTTIESYTFNECTALTSVTIPGSVTTIGKRAFNLCKNLTDLTISGSVTSIGDGAFAACAALTNVTIPDSVTSIGDSAFMSCTGLTSVTIPNSVTTIENSVFNLCASLTYVDIPDSVTSIGERAFSSSGLTNVIIPGSVVAIGEAAFSGSALNSATIADSVTTIGARAFFSCYNMKDVYYGGSKSQWNDIIFGEEWDPTTDAWGHHIELSIHYNSNTSTPATSDGVSVTVDEKTVVWTDAAPFIDANDRTMVPLRAVADAMGLDVNWDENTREASFTGSGKTITFPIDSSTARTSDGSIVTMDTAAVIVNERTYAPIRYLAEYFGYTVGWDDATRTVIITAG